MNKPETIELPLVESSKKLGRLALKQGAIIATAESCTGGMVSAALTEVPGSSAWFDRGFITYTNQAKTEMLGVSTNMLEHSGAVSETVAVQMAVGALANSGATATVAISGIAGPDGGTIDKPVGMVWMAWAMEGKQVSECNLFEGDRQSVRFQATQKALDGLINMISMS